MACQYTPTEMAEPNEIIYVINYKENFVDSENSNIYMEIV